MTTPVYLLGGARTDFKRNLKKENNTLRDVIVEVVRGAFAATGLEAADIQAGVVGNFAGGWPTATRSARRASVRCSTPTSNLPTRPARARSKMPAVFSPATSAAA